MELALIVGRRALVEPKTALTGVIFDASFARFRSSVASFNFAKASLRFFCRRDLGNIVETRGNCKEMKCCKGREGKARTLSRIGGQLARLRLVQTGWCLINGTILSY